MFLFRKNIILVPSDYDGIKSTKGLISFDCYDGMADCVLRVYNYVPNKPLTLGVAVNGKLNKFELPQNKIKNFEFNLPFTIKSVDDISCVLLDIEDDDYNIVLWGSTQINNAWKSTLKMMVENEVDLPKNRNSNDMMTDDNPKEFEFKDDFFEKINKPVEKDVDNSKSEIQRSITTEDDDLEKYIDKVIELAENDEQIIYDKDSNNNNENIIETPQKMNEIESFYERLKPQIDKMFEINQPEEVLNEIIPASKFCRVEFDDGNGYYVFGIIYDEGYPKYLCYGVPAQKGDRPPREMSTLYQWLPIDVNNSTGDGFYMMYQDAETGKNISVDII